MPGEGGLEPGTGVQFPLLGKFSAGNSATVQMPPEFSRIAPAAVSSASVARPVCTFRTSAAFAGSIRQRLASKVSMHVLPTSTESGGHLSVAARAGDAAATHRAAAPIQTRRFMTHPSFSLLRDGEEIGDSRRPGAAIVCALSLRA